MAFYRETYLTFEPWDFEVPGTLTHTKEKTWHLTSKNDLNQCTLSLQTVVEHDVFGYIWFLTCQEDGNICSWCSQFSVQEDFHMSTHIQQQSTTLMNFHVFLAGLITKMMLPGSRGQGTARDITDCREAENQRWSLGEPINRMKQRVRTTNGDMDMIFV